MSRTYSTIFYKKLVISSILFTITIFDVLFVVFFYIPNLEVIANLYVVYYYATILTFIVIVRVIVSLYASIILWRLWLDEKRFSLFTLPFLFSLFFVIFLAAKIMDVIVYVALRMYLAYGYPHDFLLYIMKVRYLIAILNILPIFLVGIYLYLFKRSLKKEEFVIAPKTKRNAALFSFLYSLSLAIFITLINDWMLFSFFVFIVAVSSFSFAIWLFIVIHRTKRLPEINSLIISIGFTCYFIVNAISPLVMNLIFPISLEGERLSALIFELGTLFSLIIIILGFKIKASYNK